MARRLLAVCVVKYEFLPASSVRCENAWTIYTHSAMIYTQIVNLYYLYRFYNYYFSYTRCLQCFGYQTCSHNQAQMLLYECILCHTRWSMLIIVYMCNWTGRLQMPCDNMPRVLLVTRAAYLNVVRTNLTCLEDTCINTVILCTYV